ncbi:MAG TPA: class I SAM-dependent methyltransferase [Dongiaceae bacterium]|nr:class I SAM-dependent methyltransferase [Dongiaceae bacterium]
MFRREMKRSERDPEVLIDPKLGDAGYVDSFGLEWQSFDGFVGKEAMSQGHVFGRFMLPKDFFAGKQVVDIGCGNGRIGRLIAPLCAAYAGADLSEAVYSFPKYTQRPASFTLLRASATDLPFADACADVTLCWGVLHHVDAPDTAFAELVRVTRPGGIILLYVYPQGLDGRKNLNAYARGLPMNRNHAILDQLSDALDEWFEVDSFYAGLLANGMAMAFKQSKPWQKFQWFDGITPRFHWSLEKRVPDLAQAAGLSVASYRPGCFVLRRPA